MIEVRKLGFSEVEEFVRLAKVKNPRERIGILNRDTEYYGVTVDNKIVSIGGMKFVGEVVTATLAYTLPEYRNKGYYHAQLQYRIKVAKERGCKIMKSTINTKAYHIAIEAGYKPTMTRPFTNIEMEL